MSSQVLKPVTDKHKEALELENKEVDEVAAWEWFEKQGYGKSQAEYEAELNQSPDKQLPGQMQIDDFIEAPPEVAEIFEDEEGNIREVKPSGQ